MRTRLSLPRRAASILGAALAALVICLPTVGTAVPHAQAQEQAHTMPALRFASYAGPAGSQATGVVTDRAGNIYVIGTVGTPPSSRAWIAKYDPTGAHLLYSTSIAAPCGALGNAIAVDASSNAYVTGEYGLRDQYSLCLLLTNVLAAKLDPSGHILYEKTIGPTAQQSTALNLTNEGNGIAVDRQGNAYITGRCDCWSGTPGMPATPGAFQHTGHLHDGFVLKLDPSGSLVYSTYLGGSQGNIIDQGNGIAVDGAGDAFVTGTTQSTDFPTTANAFQRHLGTLFKVNALSNAFLAELDPGGARLLYGTYLGGGVAEAGYGVALDGAGGVFLTGATSSPNFPTTPNAYDRTCGTDGNCNVVHVNGLFHHDVYFDDAFVVKLAPARPGAAALVYATFLGGENLDHGQALAVDRLGHVWVAGFTASRGAFPTANPVQQALGGDKDAYVAELDPARSGTGGLLFSTYLGGSGADSATALALAPHGIVLAGSTASTDFPTRGPLHASLAGASSGFVAMVSR